MAEATPMGKSSRAALILKVVGWSSIALSSLGLWYHGACLSADYSQRDTPPYFYQAWHIMAGVNIALLVSGVLVGVQLVLGRARWVRALVVLQILIVVDTFLPGGLWLNQRFGSSIAAASGISGGTIIGVMALFPIWGSWAGLWAARRIGARPVGSSGA